MQYFSTYQSPVGKMLIAADDEGLTDLYFDCEKHNSTNTDAFTEETTSIIKQTKRWLDIYFEGKRPNFTPPLHICGTPFQTEVWGILLTIPYGETVTYGEIAKTIATKRGSRMSAQAVGGAVGRNKIALIIPCHRVIGSDGSLTGYAAGTDKKQYFLEMEGVSGRSAK